MSGSTRDSGGRLQPSRSRHSSTKEKEAKEGLVLTEAQVIALERQQTLNEAHGEIETEHPGYLGSQDTYYVGTIKGIGRIYHQPFVDTYSKVAACKLYTTKRRLRLLTYSMIACYRCWSLRVLIYCVS